MQIVLLSGGSGKRLWPLSNDVRSKQFLKVLTDESGKKQSMVQRVYSQIKEVHPDTDITIATNEMQLDIIHKQLSDSVSVVVEPTRRNTFPAIALTCAYLAMEKNISMDETIIVLPADPYTELSFFNTLTGLEKLINEDAADVALIGINPLIPTSKYGYIVPKSEIKTGAYSVSRFVEKPDEKTAAALIHEGAYWNGGVFAFKLGYIMDIVKENVNFADFKQLYDKYDELEKTSFDYKVVENAGRVAVMPYYGKWTDIGTWRTLTDEMTDAVAGKVATEKTRNTFIINELDIPIVALGTKDIVIVASEDGILVSDLMESSHLKTVVDKLEA
ncbi:MAG: sugar phosphate nucleotidyltransferase [Oscillospiraceae bacterium]|nr:sugar phosphate nucleotidyltransferase [Oscillospiraceae bacterium]